ncbi:MAG: cupin domain-containing protein [Nanoarchaeota archaeon]
MKEYTSNIEKETLENEYYRKVLFTGTKMQLVVMSLTGGEEIPSEVHHDIDQFLRIENGDAMVRVDGNEHNLSDDDVIIIPAGTEHYVKNTSDSEDLKLYSIYATPEHADGTIHKTKAEADAAEAEEHHH